MNIPSSEKIKRDSGLPDSASFHGWLIHNPKQDDFLLTYKDFGHSSHRKWHPNPEVAIRFTRFAKATKIIERLEMEGSAIVVAAFDLGSQIVVLVPPECKNVMKLPSDNIFRADLK